MLQHLSVSGSTCQCCKLKQCHMLQVIKVSVSCRLSQCQCVASSHNVSVLHALTFVSVLQAVTVSVCCKLSQCQCVARINICKCVAGCHNVSVLEALTMSVCCTY